MDLGAPVSREVSQHEDLEDKETISSINEKEIGTAFDHSGMRISGKPFPDI
jgi:hypothetical protein